MGLSPWGMPEAEPLPSRRARFGFGPPTWVKAVVLAAAVAFAAAAVTIATRSDGSDGDRPSAKSVDVGFLRDMTQHHDQAVQMSLLASEDAMPDLEVRNYASEILVLQSQQVGAMRQQLGVWGYGIDPDAPVMRWMPHSMDDMAHMDRQRSGGSMDQMTAEDMPGMARQAQLDRLGDARGRQAEELFMTLMIRHHRGSIAMADYAAHHAETRYVRRAAADFTRFQRIEINEMHATAKRLGLTLSA